jgi:hypothetical protein
MTSASKRRTFAAMKLLRGGATTLWCVAACALSGCGLSASPADGLRFQPPAGWRSSPGILGFMQFWRPPSGVREVLMLFKSPKPVTSGDMYSDANMQGAFKSVTVQRKRSIKICGNQPALFVQGIAISRENTESNVEMVLANVRGTSYFAMYVRPTDVAPDPQAEGALYELCAKS